MNWYSLEPTPISLPSEWLMSGEQRPTLWKSERTWVVGEEVVKGDRFKEIVLLFLLLLWLIISHRGSNPGWFWIPSVGEGDFLIPLPSPLEGWLYRQNTQFMWWLQGVSHTLTALYQPRFFPCFREAVARWEVRDRDYCQFPFNRSSSFYSSEANFSLPSQKECILL